MIDPINKQLQDLKSSSTIKNSDYAIAERLYRQGNCQILAHAKQGWDVLVAGEDDKETGEVVMRFTLPKMEQS